ncbi:hypothetical protein CPB97_009597 [Podila verticillata]|nr:hypothetical protein CPB97_009597 [Podila verticillata]
MSNPQPNPLSYRKPSTPTSTSSSTFASTTNASNKSKPLSETRIYVGNLDPTIDEYTVLKLFTPFGKITKLDFMFHWHGPKKGTPRGYCFLEFETADQATKAVMQMNRKAIKLRPLNVSLANLAPPSTDSEQGRKRTLDPSRSSTFSILKAGALKNASTNDKIKAMERKLAQMNSASSSPGSPSSPSPSPSLPTHYSLPPKPQVSRSSQHGQLRGANRDTSHRSRPY